MHTTEILLCVIGVSLASVVGALVLVWREAQVRKLVPYMVALAAGALLGDTFLHLLPHAVEIHGGFTSTVAWGVLGGLLGFFVIEGVLHWHHHGEDVHDHGPEGVHSFGWMNLLGDFIHNITDGMLIAAAWIASPEAGVATTIAVLLHEIPQEFGDFGVLLHAGFSPKKALLMNLLVGMSAVLGALFVVFFGTTGFEDLLLPIAAGGFLYIACADLVPELRDRARGAKIIGYGLALAAGLLLMVLVHEVSHDHDGHAHGHTHGGAHDHE